MKILWKGGEIAPQEQFLLFSTIFCKLILDFCVKTRTRFPLQDRRLFEIIEVEITRVDYISKRSSAPWFRLENKMTEEIKENEKNITIPHECPCRTGKSHPRGQNFYQGGGLPSPWLKFQPEGEISLSYMDWLMMDYFSPTFSEF